MPYEVEAPLGVAAATAGAFLSGQEQARQQRLKERLAAEDSATAARQAAAQADYWRANVAERTERDRLVAEGKDKDRIIKQQLADQQAQRDRDRKQLALMMYAERVKQREQQKVIAFHHDATARQSALDRIEAAHQDVQARIKSGELNTSKRVDAEYAAIAQRDRANIRTTTTSSENNQRTVQGAWDRNWLNEEGRTDRFNAGEEGRNTRAGINADVRTKKPPGTTQVPTSRVTPQGRDPVTEGYYTMAVQALQHGKTLADVQQRVAGLVNAGTLTKAQGDELLRRLQILENQMRVPQGGAPAGQAPFRLPGVTPALLPGG